VSLSEDSDKRVGVHELSLSEDSDKRRALVNIVMSFHNISGI
jgi:hypothetical protein